MDNISNRTNHFMLVHGSGHGAWCWYKVVSLLQAAGYRVTVPDMAASGIDSRQIAEVATFSEYSQPLIDTMRELPEGEKVILVGHSFGGLNVALAMEQFPERVAAAVFLTALMPDCEAPPLSLIDKMFSSIDDFMDCEILSYGEEKHLTSYLFGPKFLQAKLYQLSSVEDLTLATTLMRHTTVFKEDFAHTPPFSKSRYGSVDAFYIVCAKDLWVGVENQRSMIEKYPVKEVKIIEEADHMAMMSAPKKLCKCLLDIAKAYT